MKPNNCNADMWPLDAGGYDRRRGRSYPPQWATSREGKQSVRMAVTDRSVTSRTLSQHIESVTHHSVPHHSTCWYHSSRVVCPQDVHCLVYP
ncbi:hypothetical protein TNCV_3257681 [Trichonephila clavipes]|nr:hypothetical protein TNCV_3257681 [Trichonephila clavipes]